MPAREAVEEPDRVLVIEQMLGAGDAEGRRAAAEARREEPMPVELRSFVRLELPRCGRVDETQVAEIGEDDSRPSPSTCSRYSLRAGTLAISSSPPMAMIDDAVRDSTRAVKDSCGPQPSSAGASGVGRIAKTMGQGRSVLPDGFLGPRT